MPAKKRKGRSNTGRRAPRRRQQRSPLTDGKICYVEIPSTDVRRSADFCERVFKWKVRERGDGRLAFDDSTGQVSGTWVTGRPAESDPHLLLYIMVDDIRRTLEAVTAHGGQIVQPVGMDAPEITARISDPDGNVMGLYQPPARSRSRGTAS